MELGAPSLINNVIVCNELLLNATNYYTIALDATVVNFNERIF